MKDIIANSIKSAGMTETEVAEWVSNLKAFHDEETKRREQREFDLRVQINAHDIIANNIKSTGEQLDARVKALGQLELQVAQEREELRRVKQDLQRERQLLRETIEKLKPKWWIQLIVAFLAALSALALFLGVLRFVPDVLRWIGVLFGESGSA